jgi:hypothetical protein
MRDRAELREVLHRLSDFGHTLLAVTASDEDGIGAEN